MDWSTELKGSVSTCCASLLPVFTRKSRTTLVYAKIVDRKKEDAVALIPDFSDCD
ncbi:MAG: hypothetical protein J5732_09220 [Bacteroidaceae bacterium]|nr:hypothetical protein [Bacteroidaceae bacterium]